MGKGIDININIHIDEETLKNLELDITPEDIKVLSRLFSSFISESKPQTDTAKKSYNKDTDYIRRYLKNAEKILNNENKRKYDFKTPNKFIPKYVLDETYDISRIKNAYENIMCLFRRIQNSMYKHNIPVVELEFELDNEPAKFVIQQSNVTYVSKQGEVRMFMNFEDLRCEAIDILKPLLTEWNEQAKKVIINIYKTYLIEHCGIINP